MNTVASRTAYLESLLETNPNMAIPWYLMAAYAYYHLDKPLLTDGLYDKMAKDMLDNWSRLEHRHKHLIPEDDLRAGTLLLAEKDFPKIVKGATVRLLYV